MALSITGVHVYERIPGRAEVRLVRTNPYTMFVRRGEPDILFQDGRFYDAGGQKVKKVPDWVWEQAGMMKKSYRARIRLVLPSEKGADKAVAVEQENDTQNSGGDLVTEDEDG